LIDVFRRRLNYPDLKRAIVSHAEVLRSALLQPAVNTAWADIFAAEVEITIA
jgi:hypothetical protein